MHVFMVLNVADMFQVFYVCNFVCTIASYIILKTRNVLSYHRAVYILFLWYKVLCAGCDHLFIKGTQIVLFRFAKIM